MTSTVNNNGTLDLRSLKGSLWNKNRRTNRNPKGKHDKEALSDSERRKSPHKVTKMSFGQSITSHSPQDTTRPIRSLNTSIILDPEPPHRKSSDKGRKRVDDTPKLS